MNRQEDLRKKEYVAQCPQEEFIVPLLKTAIEKNIKEIIEKFKPKNVLDVGSGSMPFKELFHSYGIDYFSFDPNSNQNPDFIGEIDGDISEMILTDRKFDLIFCTEVLEHVANWDITFSNFYKLLNENGVILITAPHFYSLHEVPYDFWRPTPYAFSYFAKKNNLEIVKSDLLGTFWDLLGTLYANTPKFYIKESKINLKNKLYLRIINFVFRLIYSRLRNGFFEENFNAACYMYQSNLVILKK